MVKNEPSLVLYSGRQDSTTCLFWALNVFKEVRALCINYGQRHSLEIEVAQKIATKANIPFQTLDATVIGRLVENSLTPP